LRSSICWSGGLVVSMLLLLGCPAPGSTGGVDGGSDGGADGGSDGGVDAGLDASVDGGPGADGGLPLIRGRFESTGPVPVCGGVATWTAPDGFLLRVSASACGDDMSALANTIVANLDAAKNRNAHVLLAIGQGIMLPSSWVAECQSFQTTDPNFTGTTCVPWDPKYQARLRSALVDTIGPAVKGHPALAGVYFTISTMTNGYEMHFRADRTAIPSYPGDAVTRQAYLDVMDIYQQAFEVPVVFEAGHCPWSGSPDCETPLALYRHARDTFGRDHVGVAMWNCAERFFLDSAHPEFGARPLLEEASSDGVSMGCQTVGSFSNGACRFTDPAVADYGTPNVPQLNDRCPASATFDPEAACVDTLHWFTGTSTRNAASVQLHGTWGEIWNADFKDGGVYPTSAACHTAIDLLTRP